MTTFNGQRYLGEQLASISDQQTRPDEVHISDDFSQDGTWPLLQGWAADQSFPVHLHLNPRNMGVVTNMEGLLLRAARAGDVVVLCDQDDQWDRKKLTAVARAFERQATALWLSDGHLMDENGNRYPSRTLWSAVRLAPTDLLTSEGQLHEQGLRRLALGMTATGAAMAVRSEAAASALPFPRAMHGPNPPFLHDGWLALIAALHGEVALESSPLISYRQHQSQYTEMSLVSEAVEEAGSLRQPGRRVAIAAELDQLDMVLAAVALGKVPTCLPRRIAKLENLRNFLAMRSEPNPSAILRHLRSGNYHRFTNGMRTIALDLMRSVRRP